MKIFANQNIWKKIVLVFLVITTISFVSPKVSRADEDDNATVGGVLVAPICTLLVTIGDGAVNIIHKCVVASDESIVHVDWGSSGWKTVLKILLAAVFIMGAIYLVSSVGVVAIAKILINLGKLALKTGVIGTIIGSALVPGLYAGATIYSLDQWSEKKLDMPIYTITPEEIFRGEIPLFNVNFFNPPKDIIKKNVIVSFDESQIDNFTWLCDTGAGGPYKDEDEIKINARNAEITLADIRKGTPVTSPKGDSSEANIQYYYLDDANGQRMYRIDTYNDKYAVAVNANANAKAETQDNSTYGLSYELTNVVSSWYYKILVVAIVGMMSVLVYIGVRVLLASVAQEKSKYKQMLVDWVVGMVLLFVMHYGMTFANAFVDDLVELLGSFNARVYVPYIESNDSIEKALNEQGFNIVEVSSDDINSISDKVNAEDAMKTIYKVDNHLEMKTNLMGYIRYELQRNTKTAPTFIGYTIMFLVMVMYLLIFSYQYLKRVVYMAFLTIIAPFVALTYPIDKVNDGQAQGFNMWFKEYVFNLLLQPMHMLLYTILISSAIELATKNVLYAIIAMGFMASAEKILRQLFNFQKASTPGIFGGAAAAGLMMKGLNWITGRRAGGRGADSNESGDEGNGGRNVSTGDNSVRLNSALDGYAEAHGADSDGVYRTYFPIGQSNTQGSDNGGGGGNTLPHIVQEGQGFGTSNAQGAQGSGANNAQGAQGLGANNAQGAQGLGANNTQGTQGSGAHSNIIAGGKRVTPRNRRLKNGRPQRISLRAPSHKNVGVVKRFTNSAVGQGIGAYVGAKKPKIARNVSRAIGAGALGITAGMLAASTQIAASASPEQVITTGIAAATGGAKLGESLVGNVKAPEDIKKAANVTKAAMLGQAEVEREEAIREQRRAMKDENKIRAVQNKLKVNRQEAKELLKDMIPFYYDNKITDMNEILKIEKVSRSDDFRGDREKAYIGYQLSNLYNVDSNVGKNKKNDIFERWNEEFGWDKGQSSKGWDLAIKYGKQQKI